MYILLILLFIPSAFANDSNEICLHSHILMETYYHTGDVLSKVRNLENQIAKNNNPKNIVKMNDEGHCLSIEGDDKFIAEMKKIYEDKKKELPVPLNTELTNIKVAFYFHNAPAPIMVIPETNKFEIYDHDKQPVEISARVVHPELIEVTYKSPTLQNKKVYKIGEPIHCLHHPKVITESRTVETTPNKNLKYVSIQAKEYTEQIKPRNYFFKDARGFHEIGSLHLTTKVVYQNN